MTVTTLNSATNQSPSRELNSKIESSSSKNTSIQSICINESQIYRGPNLFEYRSVVRLKLALGDLESFPTNKLDNFSTRLLELMPTLYEHGCSYGYDGGFVKRLEDGTWLGHVTGHIAIELQCLAALPVSRGKTRGTDEPGGYDVVYTYVEERVGLLAGWMALRLVNHLLPPSLQGIENLDSLLSDGIEPLVSPHTPFDYHVELEALILRAQNLVPGPTTQSLVNEALRRNIPALRLDDQSLVQSGYGKYQKRICAGITNQTSHIALQTVGDKALTNRLLTEAGIPCPRSVIVDLYYVKR